MTSTATTPTGGDVATSGLDAAERAALDILLDGGTQAGLPVSESFRRRHAGAAARLAARVTAAAPAEQGEALRSAGARLLREVRLFAVDWADDVVLALLRDVHMALVATAAEPEPALTLVHGIAVPRERPGVTEPNAQAA